MWSKEKKREQEERAAERHVVAIEAARVLATNNDFACTLEINGLKISLCNNETIIPVLDSELREVKNFLSGIPNMYE